MRAPSERTEQVRVHVGRADGTADPIPFFVLDTGGSLRNVKAAGDVNGDGLGDLIAVSFGGPSFVVYGDLSAPVVSEPLRFDGEVHARIDLDGDGRMDLLSTDYDEVDRREEHRVLLGGSNTLVEVPAGGSFVGSIPDPNDAQRDLMVGAVLLPEGIVLSGIARWTGEDFVMVDLGLPGFPFARGQVLGDGQLDSLYLVLGPEGEPCATEIGNAARVLGELRGGRADACGDIWVSVAGDLDQDGFDELLETVWGADGSQGLRIHHGGRDALTVGASVLPTLEEAYQPIESPALFGAGDVDGDGRADLLGLDSGDCSVMVAGGADPLRAVGSCAWPELFVPLDSPPIPVGDQDGRAGEEVLVPGTGLVSFGGGALEILPNTLDMPYASPIGDVDDDGFVDVLVGTSVFAGGPSLLSDAPVVITLGGSARGTWLGDVNGDGIDDVVIDSGLRFGGADVASRPNDVELPAGIGVGWQLVRVGDRDGDGRADLAIIPRDTAETIVFSLRDGALVELERVESVIQFADDVDGDGRAEIHALYQLVMSVTGERVDVSPYSSVVGDLDGDGMQEIVDQGRPMRWNGASFEQMVVEHQVPADAFVLSAVL